MDFSSVVILYDNPLGAGAFGSVYRAFQPTAEGAMYLAVKESRGDLDSDTSRALIAEFDTLVSLRHDNVVAVRGLQVDHAAGVCRLYLEWVPGGSLSSVAKSLGGALHESAIKFYLRDALRGLAYLHSQGIIHRDVKPANMLVDANGRVKISDFGTRKIIAATAATKTAQRSGDTIGIAGTPAYMDAASLQGKATEASDVWALGCSVVELASGYRPWSELDIDEPLALMFHIAFRALPPEHFPSVPDHLSGALQRLLARCFAHLPQDRPSAAELLNDGYFTELADGALPEDAETNFQYILRRAARSDRADQSASGTRTEELLACDNGGGGSPSPSGVSTAPPMSREEDDDSYDLVRMFRGVDNVPDRFAAVLSAAVDAGYRLGSVPEDLLGDAKDYITVAPLSASTASPPPVHAQTLTLRSLSLQGAVTWSALPRRIVNVDISGNCLHGQVNLTSSMSVALLDTASLRSAWRYHECLRVLHLQCNALSGTFDLNALPPLVEKVSLRSNNFTGPLALTSLPSSLVELDLSRNSFSGFVELRMLPPGLTDLNVGYNNLSGTLDLSALPQTLNFLHCNNNHFTGCVDLRRIPASLSLLNLFSNRLGPPGRKPQYGSGIIGLSPEGLLYLAKKRIASMSPLDRDKPEYATPPDEVASIEAQFEAAFPTNKSRSIMLSANAFVLPLGLSGSATMGRTQVQF